MTAEPQPSSPAGGFQPTIMAEIRELQQGHWQALDGWYGRYKPPLVTHLQYKFRLSPADAESIFHDFLHDKVIKKEIIRQYDRERGAKFRNFILKSLANYARDWFRKQNRLSLREPQDRVFEEVETMTDVEADRDWARALLASAADRTRRHYEERGQPERWLIFEQRILLPRLTGARPASVGELIDRCQLHSPSEVSQRLVRAKETFERFLHELICQSAGNRAEVEFELGQLKQIWRGGP